MSDIIGRFALWSAVIAEITIFAYVIAMSIKYCVPWDELRAKRGIREMLRGRIPAHRERVRRLAAKANHPVRRYRARWARELGDAMTKDAVRLLGLSRASIDAIEKHLGPWPREAAQIDRDVDATLGCIEQMLRLRDVTMPETVRLRRDLAREIHAGLSSLRDEIAAKVEGYVAKGHALAYERRCITLLGNAFVAHAACIEDDPDVIFARASKWRCRIADIAIMTELRVAVADRIAEIGDAMPRQTARIRQLVTRAGPLIRRLSLEPRPKEFIVRIAMLTTAEANIEGAENRLRTAKAVAAEEGTDLGTEGRSAKRLKEALLMAERARQTLSIVEEDLLVAVTAMDVAGKIGDKDPN